MKRTWREGVPGWRLWLLAAIFAGISVLARSFAQAGTAELATGQKLLSLALFAGLWLLLTLLMALLERALVCKASPKRWPAWVCALILAACWLPYLFVVWPGTVSNDSITQLSEIVGAKSMSNGNPVFQTALLWLCVRFGQLFSSGDAAIALYVCVQAALMAWLLGAAVSRMRALGAPRWLCGGSLALYALCPVFPVFAFCVGKDTNFAMAALWLALAALRFLTEEKPKPAAWVALCLSAALCALLRNPGVYLALGVLALLLLVRRGARGAALAAMGAVAAVWCAVNLLIVPGLSIEPVPETENWSVPLQQAARVSLSEELTDAQRETLEAVLDTSDLKQKYNGELSDPVKDRWRADATPEQKSAFWRLWLELLRQHPATCLSATFHNSFGYLTPGYVSSVKPTLLLGAQGRTTAIDGAFDFSVNPRAEALRETFERWLHSPLFALLTAPGLYAWLILFAFAVCRARKNGLALCLLPALFVLAGCLFSAVNAYFRYAMPLYLAAPLCLALCAAAPKEGLR
ncbi:MAG: DUF6020 family protein [Eubacteriales bacterium]|nr:DUF6020 family protein [Eubacteriales bacterium]